MSSLILHVEPLIEPLTMREGEVLQELSEGHSNEQISITLVITEKTVKGHLSTIFSKMNVTTRLEAVVSAYQLGLVVLPGEATPEETAVAAIEYKRPGTLAKVAKRMYGAELHREETP